MWLVLVYYFRRRWRHSKEQRKCNTSHCYPHRRTNYQRCCACRRHRLILVVLCTAFTFIHNFCTVMVPPNLPSAPTAAPTTEQPTFSPSPNPTTGQPTPNPTTGQPTPNPTTGQPTTSQPTPNPTTDQPTTGPPTPNPTTSQPTPNPTTGQPTPMPTSSPVIFCLVALVGAS
jgi:hypothetical protein